MTEQAQPRITPEAALVAYQQTGKTPKQWTIVSKNCACAIGVLHVAAGKPINRNEDILTEAEDTYGIAYVGGFMAGFDGNDVRAVFSERHLQGYEDGKAVWAAVRHLAEVGT